LQADRFSYLTAWIPVLILIFCLEGSKLNKKIFVILIGGLIGTQTLLSYKQHQIWENTKILVESIRNTKYVQTNQWVNAFLYWSEGKDAEMRKNYKEAFTKYSLISKIEVKGAKVKGEELSDILFKTIFLNSLGGEKESTDFLLSLDQKTLEYYEERFKNKNKSSSIEE
jgi:hypothetical protein